MVLIGFDIAMAFDGIPGNTLGEFMRKYSGYTLFIPLAVGVLIGHWFHPGDNFEAIAGDKSTTYLIVIVASLTVVGAIFGFSKKLDIPRWPWVMVGMTAGSLLWPVHVMQ